MLRRFIEFVGHSVRAGSRPGNASGEWVFVGAVTLLVIAVVVFVYAFAS